MANVFSMMTSSSMTLQMCWTALTRRVNIRNLRMKMKCTNSPAKAAAVMLWFLSNINQDYRRNGLGIKETVLCPHLTNQQTVTDPKMLQEILPRPTVMSRSRSTLKTTWPDQKCSHRQKRPLCWTMPPNSTLRSSLHQNN